ncbi:MAG: hypothetical protein JW884_00160 [Deltaproteobacteria bacterium]|nr:hypothetical protein [Deltaproteobacteria bacterium]
MAVKDEIFNDRSSKRFKKEVKINGADGLRRGGDFSLDLDFSLIRAAGLL